MRCLTLALMSLLVPLLATGGAATEGGGLKLVITVEQQALPASLPVRVTLHLHNSGDKTLWLYRPVRAADAEADENSPDTPRGLPGRATPSIEGSTVAVRLEGTGSGATSSGQGKLLNTVGLPHPKLVRLAPGEDDEIKTAIRLLPAQVGIGEALRPVWGKYKFTVTYAAKYSNAEDVERILGVHLWHGRMESNSVVLDLQPPPGTAIGAITGTVVSPTNIPLDGIVVSLTDRAEMPMDQVTTDLQGKYLFSHLTPGMYWVTIRRKEASEDTAIFRHLDLAPGEASGTVDFALTPLENYEPKQMLHKPVLFLVEDSSGAPLANVGLEITWSSGTVLDSVKGITSSDGIVALELIPGRNYVTLKRHGCPKAEERTDVTEGPGVDEFKMVFPCSRK